MHNMKKHITSYYSCDAHFFFILQPMPTPTLVTDGAMDGTMNGTMVETLSVTPSGGKAATAKTRRTGAVTVDQCRRGSGSSRTGKRGATGATDEREIRATKVTLDVREKKEQ